jgi:hypothetical protein
MPECYIGPDDLVTQISHDPLWPAPTTLDPYRAVLAGRRQSARGRYVTEEVQSGNPDLLIERSKPLQSWRGFSFSEQRNRPGRFVEARALGASSVVAAAGAAIFVLQFGACSSMGKSRRFAPGRPWFDSERVHQFRGRGSTAENSILPRWGCGFDPRRPLHFERASFNGRTGCS